MKGQTGCTNDRRGHRSDRIEDITGRCLRRSKILYGSLLAVGVATILTTTLAKPSALQVQGEAVRVGNGGPGGVVTSTKGPDAGRLGDR